MSTEIMHWKKYNVENFILNSSSNNIVDMYFEFKDVLILFGKRLCSTFLKNKF